MVDKNIPKVDNTNGTKTSFKILSDFTYNAGQNIGNKAKRSSITGQNYIHFSVIFDRYSRVFFGGETVRWVK